MSYADLNNNLKHLEKQFISSANTPNGWKQTFYVWDAGKRRDIKVDYYPHNNSAYCHECTDKTCDHSQVVKRK